jgi:hypothetical protein
MSPFAALSLSAPGRLDGCHMAAYRKVGKTRSSIPHSGYVLPRYYNKTCSGSFSVTGEQSHPVPRANGRPSSPRN